MSLLSKTCLYCGKTFFKSGTTSLADWNNQSKYCSHLCYAKAETKPPTKICPVCGKLFKSKVWAKNAIHCSTNCAHASRRKPLPNCEVCGKPVKKLRRRFCSHACKTEWYQGENVYSYLGENCKKNYIIDLTFWVKRAKEIRVRDKVCQHCNKTPKQNRRALDVHHIIPYRISKDNSPSNLIALCRICHKKADHKLNGHKLSI